MCEKSNLTASPDEVYIGSAAVLLPKGSYVSKLLRPEKRLTTKTSFPGQQYVLTVLALASWIRLTEEWYNGPDDSAQRLACVSNQGAMHLRQLGLPVHRERVQSSTPMVDKICAMCGMLMPPTSLTKDNWYHTGIAGAPCHMRGEPLPTAQWHAMPPFLMLWTKETLSRSLPAVFHFHEDSQALTLKKGIETAPWLHFHPAHLQKGECSGLPVKKSNGHVLSSETPWWYCRHCHKYWLHKSEAPVRIPMRNYQEGHYTVWSRDFGYPHLYPALKRMYSNHMQIPEPAAVLDCQRMRKRRGDLLRADYKANPLQAAQRKGASQIEADKLFKDITDLESTWFPPPHLSKWKSPIPLCCFEIAKCACPIGDPCKCISVDKSCSRWKKCKCAKWDLRKQFNDLLPAAQFSLIQDGPHSAPLDSDKLPKTMEKYSGR